MGGCYKELYMYRKVHSIIKPWVIPLTLAISFEEGGGLIIHVQCMYYLAYDVA